MSAALAEPHKNFGNSPSITNSLQQLLEKIGFTKVRSRHWHLWLQTTPVAGVHFTNAY